MTFKKSNYSANANFNNLGFNYIITRQLMIVQGASQSSQAGFETAVITLHSLLTPMHDSEYLEFYNGAKVKIDNVMNRKVEAPKKFKPNLSDIESQLYNKMFEELMKLLDRSGKLNALPVILDDDE